MRHLNGVCILPLLFAASAGFCGGVDQGEWVVTRGGKPTSVIVIPRGSEASVTKAAQEIQKYVLTMSGAQLEILEGSFTDSSLGKGKTVIQVGPSAVPGKPGDMQAETMVIKTESVDGQKVIRLSGGSGIGVTYAVYAFLEMLGVRYFHPEEEYIPKKTDLALKAVDIVESPAYKWRGIQQHTIHPIPHTKMLLESPTEANLLRNYRYIDWLVKNRQNYFFWWWVERVKPKDVTAYIRRIVDYAHSRGVKTGIVVGMPFSQQNSYDIIRGDACHSDKAAWVKFLHQGVDEIAGMGIDAICVFFGQDELASFRQPKGCSDVVSPVKATVERIEELRSYARSKYPDLKLVLWVHPTAGVKGDESCPNFFFLPSQCSPDICAAVHTVMFYNLFDAAPTYGNKDFSALREFALQQSKVRPVWYWPETAYACGLDSDVPQYLPGYIYSRWVDAEFMAGKVEGHITFSTGLEWMYWLNDYAVARFGWDSRRYSATSVIDEFSSIFSTDVSGVVNAALVDLMMANDHYLVKLSRSDGFNLLNLLSTNSTIDHIGRFSGRSAEELKSWRELYIPALEGLTARYHSAVMALDAVKDKVGPAEQPWFDELSDSLAITHLRCLYQLKALDSITQFMIDEKTGANAKKPDLSQLAAIRKQADRIAVDRARFYRYPSGGSEGNFNTLIKPISDWDRVSQCVEQYINLDILYKGMAKWVRAQPFRLNVYAPVGRSYKATFTIPDDFPVDRPLALFMTIDDVDSPKEGVVVVGGKEYPLKQTGDSRSVEMRLDVPGGIFKHGTNSISFRFNDDVNGTTRGYHVTAVCIAVMNI